MEGHQVEVVKTLKSNGENCQISWNPDVDAWIVASKNVSIIAKSIEDLELYAREKTTRYIFASLMANYWFKFIN